MSKNNFMYGFEESTWGADHYAKQINEWIIDKLSGETYQNYKFTKANVESILDKFIELNDKEAEKNTFSFFGEGEPKGKGKWIGDLFNTIIENADSIDTCLSIFSICETKSRYHEAPRNYVHEHYVSARNKIASAFMAVGTDVDLRIIDETIKKSDSISLGFVNFVIENFKNEDGTSKTDLSSLLKKMSDAKASVTPELFKYIIESFEGEAEQDLETHIKQAFELKVELTDGIIDVFAEGNDNDKVNLKCLVEKIFDPKTNISIKKPDAVKHLIEKFVESLGANIDVTVNNEIKPFIDNLLKLKITFTKDIIDTVATKLQNVELSKLFDDMSKLNLSVSKEAIDYFINGLHIDGNNFDDFAKLLKFRLDNDSVKYIFDKFKDSLDLDKIKLILHNLAENDILINGELFDAVAEACRNRVWPATDNSPEDQNKKIDELLFDFHVNVDGEERYLHFDKTLVEKLIAEKKYETSIQFANSIFRQGHVIVNYFVDNKYDELLTILEKCPEGFRLQNVAKDVFSYNNYKRHLIEYSLDLFRRFDLLKVALFPFNLVVLPYRFDEIMAGVGLDSATALQVESIWGSKEMKYKEIPSNLEEIKITGMGELNFSSIADLSKNALKVLVFDKAEANADLKKINDEFMKAILNNFLPGFTPVGAATENFSYTDYLKNLVNDVTEMLKSYDAFIDVKNNSIDDPNKKLDKLKINFKLKPKFSLETNLKDHLGQLVHHAVKYFTDDVRKGKYGLDFIKGMAKALVSPDEFPDGLSYKILPEIFDDLKIKDDDTEEIKTQKEDNFKKISGTLSKFIDAALEKPEDLKNLLGWIFPEDKNDNFSKHVDDVGKFLNNVVTKLLSGSNDDNSEILDGIKSLTKQLLRKILPEIFDDLKIKEGDTEENVKNKKTNLEKICTVFYNFIDNKMESADGLKKIVGQLCARLGNSQNENDNFISPWFSYLLENIKSFGNDIFKYENLSDENITNLESLSEDGAVLVKEFLSDEKKEENDNGMTENKSVKMLDGVKNVITTIDKFVSENNFGLYKKLITGCLFSNEKLAEAVIDKISSEIGSNKPNFDLMKDEFGNFESLCGQDIVSGYGNLAALKANIKSYCENKNIAAGTKDQTLNYLSEIKNYIADKMKVGTKENKNILTCMLNKVGNQDGILKFVKPELFQQANDILFKYFDGTKNKNEINGIFNGVIDGCMDLLNATKKVKVKNANNEEEEKTVVDQKKMIASLEKLLGVVNNISKENQIGFKKFLMCGIDILKDIINDESPESVLSSAVEKIDFLKPKNDNSDKTSKDALKNDLKSKIKSLGLNLVSILSKSIENADISAGAAEENKLITLINNGFAAYKKLMSGIDSKNQKEIIASVQDMLKLVSDLAASAPDDFENLLKSLIGIADRVIDDASIFDSVIEKFGPKEKAGAGIDKETEMTRVANLKNKIRSDIKIFAKKMTKLLSDHIDKEKAKSSDVFYDFLGIYKEMLEATKKDTQGRDKTDYKVMVAAVKKMFEKTNSLIGDNLSDLKEILKSLVSVFSEFSNEGQIFDSLLDNVGFLTDDLKSKIKESIPKIATAFSNRIDKIQNKSDLKELFEGVINEYENLLANKNNDKEENDVDVKVNFIGTVKIIAGLLKKGLGDELGNLLDSLIKDFITNQKVLNSVIDVVTSQLKGVQSKEEYIKYINLLSDALPTIAKLLFDYVGNTKEEEIKEFTSNFISISKKISEAFKQTIKKDIVGQEFENAKKELNNGIDELLGLADLLTKNNLASLKLVLTNLLKSNKLPEFIAEESSFTENDIKSVFESALPFAFDLLLNHINKMNSKDEIKDILNNALNKVIDVIRVFSAGNQVKIIDGLKDMLGLVDSFAEENVNDLVELRKLFKAIVKDGKIFGYAVDQVEFLNPINKVLKAMFTPLSNAMSSSFDNTVTKKDLVDLLKELLDKYRLFAAEISKPLDIKKIKDIVKNDLAIDEITKKFDFNQDLKEKFEAFIDAAKKDKVTEKDIFDSYYKFEDELEKIENEIENNYGLSEQNYKVLKDIKDEFAKTEIDQKNIISITKEMSNMLYDRLISTDEESLKYYKDLFVNLVSDDANLFKFFISKAKKIKGLQKSLINSLPYLTKMFSAYVGKTERTKKEIKETLDDIFDKYLNFLEAIYSNDSKANYQENIINSLRDLLKILDKIVISDYDNKEEILTYCKDFFDKLLEDADILKFTISNVESIKEIAPVLSNASKYAADIFSKYIKTKCESSKDIFDMINKVFDTYLDFANSISSENENAYEYQKEIIEKTKDMLNLLDELSDDDPESLDMYKNLIKELLGKQENAAKIFIFSVSKVDTIKEIAPVLSNTLPYLAKLISEKIDNAGTRTEIKSMLANLMDKYLKLAEAISSTEPAAKYQDDIINALTEMIDVLDQDLINDNDLGFLKLYEDVIVNLLGKAEILTFSTDKIDSLKSIQQVFEKALPYFTQLLSKRIKNVKSKDELTKILKDLLEKYKTFSNSIVKDLDIKNVKEKLDSLNKSFVVSDNNKELKAALDSLGNEVNKVEPDQKSIFIVFKKIDNLVKNKKSSDGKAIDLPENFLHVYETFEYEFAKTDIDQFQAIDNFCELLNFISSELVYENKDQDNNLTDSNYEDFVEFVNNFLGDGEIFKFIIDNVIQVEQNEDKSETKNNDGKTLKQNLVASLNNICPKIAEAIRVNCKSKITNKRDVENFSGLIGNLFSIYKQTIGIFKAIKKDVSGKVVIQSSIDSFNNKDEVLRNTQKILVELISKFDNFVGYFFKLGSDAYANLNKDVDQRKIERCNELVESVSSDISDVVKSCIESEKFLSNDGPVSKLLDSIISVGKNKDDQNSKSDNNFLVGFTSLVDLFSGDFSLKIVIDKIKEFYRSFKNLFTDKTMFNKVIEILKKLVSGLKEEDLDLFFGKTTSFNSYWRKWLLRKLKIYFTESKTNDVFEALFSDIDFSSKPKCYNSFFNLIERILIVRVKDRKDATKLEIFFLDLAYYSKKALFKFIRVIIFLPTYIPYLMVVKSCDGVKGVKNLITKTKERFRELGMFDWIVKEVESLKKGNAKVGRISLKIVKIVVLAPIFILKHAVTVLGRGIKNAFKKIFCRLKGNKNQDKIEVDKDKKEIKPDEKNEKNSDTKQLETEKDKIESKEDNKDKKNPIQNNNPSVDVSEVETDVSEDGNVKSGVFDKLKDHGPKGKNDNADEKDNKPEIDVK